MLVLNAGTDRGRGREHVVPPDDARLHDEDAARGRPGERAEGDSSNTVVYYDPVQPNAKQAAQQLAPLFGSHTPRQADDDGDRRLCEPGRQSADGRRGRDELRRHAHHSEAAEGAAEAAAAGERGRRDDGARATAGLRRGALPADGAAPGRAGLDALDATDGVRGFKPLKNQHEVVLTFDINGGDEYWQIEESTWNSAPILAEPDRHHPVPRRQAPALLDRRQPPDGRPPHAGGATYWVVNTILNQLSNSTMIAIAKSLRPLHAS